MAIYLMHNIFLSMLFSVGVSVHSFGSTVGVTLLAFAACFVVTKTVATIRPGAFHVHIYHVSARRSVTRSATTAM